MLPGALCAPDERGELFARKGAVDGSQDVPRLQAARLCVQVADLVAEGKGEIVIEVPSHGAIRLLGLLLPVKRRSQEPRVVVFGKDVGHRADE